MKTISFAADKRQMEVAYSIIDQTGIPDAKRGRLKAGVMIAFLDAQEDDAAAVVLTYEEAELVYLCLEQATLQRIEDSLDKASLMVVLCRLIIDAGSVEADQGQANGQGAHLRAVEDSQEPLEAFEGQG